MSWTSMYMNGESKVYKPRQGLWRWPLTCAWWSHGPLCVDGGGCSGRAGRPLRGPGWGDLHCPAHGWSAQGAAPPPPETPHLQATLFALYMFFRCYYSSKFNTFLEVHWANEVLVTENELQTFLTAYNLTQKYQWDVSTCWLTWYAKLTHRPRETFIVS